MKIKKFNIFRRISILVFVVITTLCVFFMYLTYLSTSNFHDASTQILNKDVAGHIAKFASPFKSGGIDTKKADSVFYNAMVLSPSAEIYFLDTTGTVAAFHAPKKDIIQWVLPLNNIKELISSQGKEYIKGPDPKDPENPKIFSAAEVWDNGNKLGYIYVILGSNNDVTQTLYNSYFSGLIIKVSLTIFILSILLTFFYINRFQKRFNQMIIILERFQNGDFKARFPLGKNDELEPVATAFNKMADLLQYNMDGIIKSEKDRKDFIATISHDLRTPLSVARGYAETFLIKKEKQHSKEEQEQFLQLIYKKILQVEHMVQQLFAHSKIESVNFVPEKEPFVFSEVLQEIINEFTSSAIEKNISVYNTKTKDTSWIFADTGMMERMIQNLVVNAIKYTPQYEWIKVSLYTEEKTLVFKIQNSGQVLNEQIVNWFNNENETDLLNNRPSNTGLGLVIIKKIIQLHQFKCQVVTDENSNTFIVYMPVYTLTT
jgi:signal transduction histidine kinase